MKKNVTNIIIICRPLSLALLFIAATSADGIFTFLLIISRATESAWSVSSQPACSVQLLYMECEVGVGEWLVDQCEVPPLRRQGLESVAHHGGAQYHAVLELLGGDATLCGRLAVVAGVFAGVGVAAEVGMAFWTEPVERATHVEFLLAGHIEEGEVDGRATGVAALFHEVFMVEEHALVEVGIEIILHQCVGRVGCPTHEVIDSALRTVGVVNLKAVAQSFHVVAHGSQRVGRLAGEQCGRLFVAIDAGADKIVGAKVPNLKYGIGHCGGQCHELARVVGGAYGLLVVVGETAEQAHAACDAEDGGTHPCFCSFHDGSFCIF